MPKKRFPNKVVHACKMHIHNCVLCTYSREEKKEKESLNNVIQSMWSLSIDHMGFFTCALTSNVFDHICWHETTFKRGRVNCVHCIIKTPNTIDEDVNLILEQNDVTHEVEKEEKMWLHGLHYFHTQSNNNMYPFFCCF